MQQALQHRWGPAVPSPGGLGAGHGLPPLQVEKSRPQIKAFQQSIHTLDRVKVGEARQVLGERHTLLASHRV